MPVRLRIIGILVLVLVLLVMILILFIAHPGSPHTQTSLTSVGQSTGPIPSTPNGFTQEDLARVSPSGLTIEITNGPPKGNDDSSYPFYPLTLARSDGTGCDRNSWTPPAGGGCAGALWDYRCTDGLTDLCGGEQPNQLEQFPTAPDGNEIRLGYTDVAKAMAATEASFDDEINGCANGYTGYLKWTEAAGIPDSDVYQYNDFLTNFDNGKIPYYTVPDKWGSGQKNGRGAAYDITGTTGVPNDIVVLPKNLACNFELNLNTHIMEIDEERADNPTDGQIIGLYTDLNEIASEASPEYTINLAPDDLTGVNAPPSGLNAATIPQIMALSNFGHFLITLGDRVSGDVENGWETRLAIVSGGTLPTPTSPIMQHVGITPILEQLTPDDWIAVNHILTEWHVNWLEQQSTDESQSLGGANCVDGKPVLNPEKWANGLGIPLSCSD